MSTRGDTTNTNLQNMEPVPETNEEQVPEDLGKLTVVDKARTGRVSLRKMTQPQIVVNYAFWFLLQNARASGLFLLNHFWFCSNSLLSRTMLIRGDLTPNKQEPSALALCYTTISKTAVLFAAWFCAFTAWPRGKCGFSGVWSNKQK